MHEQDDMLTINQAADFLTTTRPTLYRWLREGKVKGIKMGRQWRFKQEELRRFLEGRSPRADLPVDLTPFLAVLRGQISDPSGGSEDPLEDAWKLMVELALERGSESLHLETFHSGRGPEWVSCLRSRTDGVLRHEATLDTRLVGSIIEKWKQMACCDTREVKLPQDGRIILTTGSSEGVEKRVDLRVSFLPSYLGESLTVRVQPEEQADLKLAELDLLESDRGRLRRALAQRSRVLVVSGPAGSALDTVLCACLREISGADKKMITVEGPAWEVVPWSTPVSLYSMGQNRSYAVAIRSVLRSEPDVIGVRRIDGRESWEAAQEAALTGTLVVAGVQADDAVSALRYLHNLSEPPASLAQTLDLVFSQMLLRKLCGSCAGSGEDCDRCGGVGYRGRLMVGESLRCSRGISELLHTDASDLEIRAAAMEEGMVSLDAQTAELVRRGVTSPEERERVLL